MSKNLHALMTKLQWQHSEQQQLFEALKLDMEKLQIQMDDSRRQTDKACAQPARLLPEQEMARLHFMMNQQQQQARLHAQQQALQAQQKHLTDNIRRLNMELNMLEKYQEKQAEHTRLCHLSIEQQQADEWALLRRASA